MSTFKWFGAAVALAGALQATSAAADETARRWTVTVEPYFMAPNMDGKASIGPLDVQVSSGPADIFRNLNWGAMGLIEVNNGKIGFAFDGTYMNLRTRRTGLIDTIGGHQGGYAGMVMLRVAQNAEAYAGVRVNDLGVRLSGTGPAGIARSASRNESWVDPIVGMRVKLPFSPKADFTMIADVGGFGAGSDISVQAWPTVGVALSSNVRAKFGYRFIYMRHDTGSGLDKFVYDVLNYGPTVGVQFSF
jgi:hypothetical protein